MHPVNQAYTTHQFLMRFIELKPQKRNNHKNRFSKRNETKKILNKQAHKTSYV